VSQRGAFETVVAGRADTLPPGGVRVVRADDRAVALFHVDGRIVAVDDACPHHGASLAEGPVRGSVVRCPWHDWSFDLATGRCGDAPVRLSVHDVEEVDGVLHVHVAPRRR
jgi:3-phenylpropionate/trans-cinnamate dioxygenase ferredoxin subunit